MRKTRVLVVDDELSIVRFVRSALTGRDYVVFTAKDGAAALQLIEKDLPDLIILDINMPVMDGFEVCRRLRGWSQIPIIMLSARADEDDKVKCLNLGADDYLTKPFGTEELFARVRAVLRRTEAVPVPFVRPVLLNGRLEINFAERRVAVGGEEVKLTSTEFNLLQELALNVNKVLTHKILLQKVWGPEYEGEREYLHVYMRHLRSKLGDGSGGPDYIVTIPGVGYRFQMLSAAGE
ncbi:MAG: response regulator transcription factor [Dehalococcoidales bacterium]|nr:response regulator transcription factor [Dehalococcoidales bacterium]